MNIKWREIGLVWVLILKRLLKRKSFWVIIVLLPLLLFATYKMEQKEEGGLRAAVYCQDEQIKERLILTENPSFYLVDSVEQLKNHVLLGKAECGYVIPEDLLYSFAKGDWYWEVEVYEGPDSMFTKLINEVLFSQIFEIVSTNWYQEYVFSKLEDKGISLSEQELKDSLLGKINNQETFRVEIIRMGEEVTGPGMNTSDSFFAPKNIVAVMIYLTSLIAVIDRIRDRELGHFRQNQRWIAAVFTIWHPTFLVALSGFFFLLCIGQSDFGDILLLALLTTVYGLILGWMVRKSKWMYGILPVLFLASMVCCPVFIDLSVILPFFRWLKVLFPFAFYL